MYLEENTVITTAYGNTGFEVNVGMHQGSGLSPLLFVIVMEAISSEFRIAYDLVVIADSEQQLVTKT